MKKYFAFIVALGFLLPVNIPAEPAPKPNFIFIFTDNQGWQDLGVYGSPDIKTPHIDQMAAEGIRFTDFYAEPSSCGPSRAALMTGSYPPRISMAFNHLPKAKTGLNHDEITIAELLKNEGYITTLIGKWHLGDHLEFLPRQHGFDSFFGIPYSNDMWPFHPLTHPTYPLEDETPELKAARDRAELTGFEGQVGGNFFPEGGNFPDLPLYDDEDVIELNPDPDTLTTRFTEKALAFIEANKDRSFFLYLAHAMPHTPLGVSDKFRGTSERGLYGDVITEIDWSVGEIIEKLKALGIDENTLIVYASDNGPWQQYGIDSGEAWPFSGGCCNELEGSARVPAIARWPGHIPAGVVSSEIAAVIDIYPTFAKLAGASLPEDRIIDGKDISPLLYDRPGAESPHEAFYYYLPSKAGEANLGAVRSGKWKLHVRYKDNLRYLGLLGERRIIGRKLYNLEKDPSEVNNVIEQHPELVARMESMAKEHHVNLLENIRPIGRVE